ncbi:MAG: DUF3734 domain-containing protein [Mesorhizobium sp.]|nr:DUF3734 domain-containing protein [Mesorhizobium sp.]
MSGKRPRSLGDALLRAQDILFAAQSRHAIRELQTEYRLRAALAKAASGSSVSQGPGSLDGDAGKASVALIHVAFSEESAAKTLDYSEASINERWNSGYQDMQAALGHYRSLRKSKGQEALPTFRFEGGLLTEYGA